MKDLKYAEAVTELEEIVSSVENEITDPDELMKKVKRAAELIKFCRSKILNAEVEINDVLAKLKEIPGKPE